MTVCRGQGRAVPGGWGGPGGCGLRVREPEQEGLTAVVMTGAGTGDVAVVIVDPQGRRDTVEVALEDKGDSTFRCTYRPVMEGPHTVHVAFAGAPITRSPFPVHVAEGKCPSPTPTTPLAKDQDAECCYQA